MPRIECDATETALIEVWEHLDASLSEKAADLQRRLRRDQLNATAIESAHAALTDLGLPQQQRHRVRRVLVRLLADLDLDDVGDELTAEAVAAAELVLRNRILVEKARALRAIGEGRGLTVPNDAQFWREGSENRLVIAWGEDRLTCEAAPPRVSASSAPAVGGASAPGAPPRLAEPASPVAWA